jgi:hypothetical protein
LDGLVADLVTMLGAEGFNKNEKEHVGAGRSIKLGGCREAEDWRHYAGRARTFSASTRPASFSRNRLRAFSRGTGRSIRSSAAE